MLDLIIAPTMHSYRVSNLRCLHEVALKSHHYIVAANLNVDLSSARPAQEKQQVNISLLKDAAISEQFTNVVEHEMQKSMQEGAENDIDVFCSS